MSDLTKMSSRTSQFLRRVLLADAATSGATGLMMMLCAGPLSELLGLQDALLRYAGLTLLPFAALVAYIATRERLWRPAVWAIVVCNALWAADSVLVLLAGWVEPNRLGLAFVIAQAVVVAVLAELEYVGLRRADAAHRLMFESNDPSAA